MKKKNIITNRDYRFYKFKGLYDTRSDLISGYIWDIHYYRIPNYRNWKRYRKTQYKNDCR